MDSTLIEEIAKQLGIAVDSAAQFLTDILPSYATMKVIECGGGLLAALVICIVGSVLMWKCAKWYAANREHEINFASDDSGPQKYLSLQGDEWNPSTILAWWRVCIIILCLLVAGTAISQNLVPLVQWATVPEAMFLQMIIDMA